MKKNHIRTALCITTAFGLAGALSPAALAMDGEAPGDAPTEDADSYSTGDIVVTAQRREEIARDVPMSITALNADMLTRAGINTTLDLGKVTPGVVLPLYGAYVLPSIRGISSNGAAVGDSPNVAVYIDGVYQPNQSAALADLPGVQSIQVLKGPQGTLYGQNAAGGAIIIDTITPQFQLQGNLNVSYGNYDDKRIDGYVTGPLGETVAVALSGAWRDRRGIAKDLLNGGHDQGLRSHQIRGKLRWEPNDATSLTFAAFYTKRGDSGIYSTAPLNGNSIGYAIAKLPCSFGGLACQNLPLADLKRREFALSTPDGEPDSIVRTYGYSLRGEFDLENIGTLSTMTAYNDVQVVNFSDVDNSPVHAVDFYLKVKERDWIQELNFTSEKFGGLTVAAGLFFLDKKDGYFPNISRIYPSNAGGLFNTAWPAVPTPILTFANVAKVKKKSYAAYLDLTYDITEQLSLTVAGRYSYEKVLVFNSPLASYRRGDRLPDPAPDPRGHFTFKKFTPRAVLRFKPDENNTLYASYSKGFKSGFVNFQNVNLCTPQPTCIDPPVDPEVVDAFEVGYKGKLWDILDLSLSAFHYKYKNIQVFVFNPGPPPKSSYQNAAAGEINGAEFDLSLRPIPDLTVNFSGAYLDAKYKSFPAATVYVPSPLGFGNVQTAADVSGNRLMRTPKWTLNGSISYTHEIDAGEFGVYVGANYNSGIFFDPNNRVEQPAYALVDAELSFAPASIPGLRAVLWGKNLTDKDYLQSVLESQLQDAASFADPRTYGVRLEYKF